MHAPVPQFFLPIILGTTSIEQLSMVIRIYVICKPSIEIAL